MTTELISSANTGPVANICLAKPITMAAKENQHRGAVCFPFATRETKRLPHPGVPACAVRA